MTDFARTPLDADVIVAGGGMTGLTLGLALAQAGLKVIAADADVIGNQVAATYDGRASAIAYASFRMWEALGLGAVSLVLAGVAVMLWAVTPLPQIHQPLALLATPLVPAVTAIFCWWYARGLNEERVFDKLRQQIRADLLMLREVSPT